MLDTLGTDAGLQIFLDSLSSRFIEEINLVITKHINFGRDALEMLKWDESYVNNNVGRAGCAACSCLRINDPRE